MMISEFLSNVPDETDIDIWLLDFQGVGQLYDFGVAEFMRNNPAEKDLEIVSVHPDGPSTYYEITVRRA